MSAWHGYFIWYELMTADVDPAMAFYQEVMGWGRQAWAGDGEAYHLFKRGEEGVAGVMKMPPGVQAPPHWMGYIGCTNVDQTAAAAEAAGAVLHVRPQDIPQVGRFAVMEDPQGAHVALFTPGPGSPDTAPGAPGVGEFSWRELITSDVDAALAFYGALFGWEKKEAHDMGGGMIYQIFGTKDRTLGGCYKKTPEMPGPFAWLYYTKVANIDTAAAKVKSGGGRVLHGPAEVPGGDRIAICMDPQGAVFALQS